MRYIPALLRNLSAKMPLLSFVLFFSCASLAEAAPSVSGFRLSAGSAVRIQKYQNAELSCTIENPDAQEHRISIRMLAQEGAQTGYYTDQITVPASSIINYRTLVQAEMSEKYKVEVFCDGKKMSYKGDEIFMKLLPPKASQLLIIDDMGNGLGSFSQQKYFKDRFFVSTINSEKLSSVWTALKDFQYIVLNSADFTKMRPMQFTALLDYTANGGIIIFSNPEAATAAWNTPLAALLPIIPARIRKTDSLPEISGILSKFQGFNEKNPPSFLESAESGDGFTILSKDKMPVFRWKKYGFGSARFSAIPLSDESWKSKQDWEDILKLYFSKPELSVNYKSSEEALDLMTGVSIPSSGVVKAILAAYFILLFIIAGLGLYFRKAALGWLSAAALSVICTGAILAGASGRSGDKGKLAASISIETVSPGKGAPKESFFSFYSSKALQTSLRAESQFDFLSTITPMQNSLMAIYAAQDKSKNAKGKDNYGGSMMQSVRKLEVTRENGTQLLKDLSINANDSRQFMMTGRNQDSTQTEFPELVFSASGLETIKVPLPTIMKSGDTAFISFPSGTCLPLKRNGNMLEIPQTEQAFHDNAVEQALENMIKEAFKKSSPALIISSKTRKNSLSQDFSTQGIELSAIPLKETYKADQSLLLPSTMIPISAADSSSRMIFEGNRFKKDFPCTGEQNFSLLFSLPSAALFLEPEEITVRFEYRNNGANINAIPLLYTSSKIPEESDIFAILAKEDKARAAAIPKDKKGKKIQPSSSVFGSSMKGRLLSGTEVSKGSFKFTGEALKGVIDSLNGNGTVVIAGLERDKTLTEEQKIKANSWTPVKLEVQVKGKLKMPQNSFSY